MLSEQVVRICEEVSPILNPSDREFKFICFRAVSGHRQEMIAVRLPMPMKAGEEMWELIKATQEELKRKFTLDSVTTLGAMSNCVWMSMASIQSDRPNIVTIAHG